MIKHKECKESQRAKVTVGRRQMSDVERSHIMNHKLCYLFSQHVAYIKKKMHSFPKHYWVWDKTWCAFPSLNAFKGMKYLTQREGKRLCQKLRSNFISEEVNVKYFWMEILLLSEHNVGESLLLVNTLSLLLSIDAYHHLNRMQLIYFSGFRVRPNICRAMSSVSYQIYQLW